MRSKAELRGVELKLIAELMKNSRRSDRELARTIGTSQPTVTRLRAKLEKEGYVQEYTVIPNFAKLDCRILALTFLKLSQALDTAGIGKARTAAIESLRKGPFEIVMLERGMGMGYDGVIISYHKDYASFIKLLDWVRHFDFLDLQKIDSFLVDLMDPIRYRPFTFSTLAQHLLMGTREKEEQQP